MPTAKTDPLTSPIEDLLATPTSRLPYQQNVLLRSYVLVRPTGNIIISNSPDVSESAAAIEALGAPSHLLVNHERESMYGQPTLDAPSGSTSGARPRPRDRSRSPRPSTAGA